MLAFEDVVIIIVLFFFLFFFFFSLELDLSSFVTGFALCTFSFFFQYTKLRKKKKSSVYTHILSKKGSLVENTNKKKIKVSNHYHFISFARAKEQVR